MASLEPSVRGSARRREAELEDAHHNADGRAVGCERADRAQVDLALFLAGRDEQHLGEPRHRGALAEGVVQQVQQRVFLGVVAVAVVEVKALAEGLSDHRRAVQLQELAERGARLGDATVDIDIGDEVGEVADQVLRGDQLGVDFLLDGSDALAQELVVVERGVELVVAPPQLVVEAQDLGRLVFPVAEQALSAAAEGLDRHDHAVMQDREHQAGEQQLHRHRDREPLRRQLIRGVVVADQAQCWPCEELGDQRGAEKGRQRKHQPADGDVDAQRPVLHDETIEALAQRAAELHGL